MVLADARVASEEEARKVAEAQLEEIASRADLDCHNHDEKIAAAVQNIEYTSSLLRESAAWNDEARGIAESRLRDAVDQRKAAEKRAQIADKLRKDAEAHSLEDLRLLEEAKNIEAERIFSLAKAITDSRWVAESFEMVQRRAVQESEKGEEAERRFETAMLLVAAADAQARFQFLHVVTSSKSEERMAGQPQIQKS